MARKSKSSKDTENSKTSEKADEIEIGDSDATETSESSDGGSPVIIEAEAVDVTPSEENSPEEETPDSSEEIESEEAQSEDPESVSNGDTSEEPPSSDVSEPVAVAQPPEPARASPVPLVIGGIIAGGLGYLVALLTPPDAVDTTELSASIAWNGAQLEELSASLSELQNAPVPQVDLSGLEDTIAGLSGRLDDLDGDLTSVRDAISGALADVEEASNALSDRLTVLETAGPGDSEAAQATEQDLAAFRAELDRMTAEAEERVAASLAKASEIESAALATAAQAEEAAAEAKRLAAEAAALTERDAAVATLKTALESGQGFADQVAILGDVPDVLSESADSGVITLVELQQSFADAARAALASAETVPQDASAGERFTAFLKQRTNARSLTPQEGDGADAILSRAEAMMKQGDLTAALTELDALGDGPKAAMQPWLDQAQTREAALAAAEQLTATN